MKKRKLIKITVLLMLLVIVPTTASFLSLPGEYQIIKGSRANLDLRFPVEISITSNQGEEIKINGQDVTESGLELDRFSPLFIQASSVGQFQLDFNLFGILPLQRMVVEVMPEVEVIPGGQCVGVVLHSEGIMVVRNSSVNTKGGEEHFPAQEAGIEVGDLLLEVNGEDIKNKYHLARLVNKLGHKHDKLNFKVEKRNGDIVEKEVAPIKSREGYYMIGIYVDDGASGVGTISFYDAEEDYYGALGHMVTEANTNLRIDVKEGEIVRSNISGIREGRQGSPGEKLGTFFSEEGTLGTIDKNNQFGIYGRLNEDLDNPYFEDPIPVASIHEIERGPAHIYTVLEGEKIEKFEVVIEEVRQQFRPRPKGLIVKITDDKLLDETGGIIQGMSGSPIVQDGKFVGAITHVFVNDATRGYGVMAQWMVMESGLVERKKENTRELVS